MFAAVDASMYSKDAEISERYYICRDVHVCASSGHVVFLDLNSGRYLNLPQRATNALGRHVVDWPVAENSESHEEVSPKQTRKLLDQLAHKGLLTTAALAYENKQQAAVAP